MNHVVFFKLSDLDTAREAARRLAALDGVVPSLQSVEVGVDEARSARSWDVCLITRFADAAGFEAYRDHPAHLEVVAWLKEVGMEAAAVDWSSGS